MIAVKKTIFAIAMLAMCGILWHNSERLVGFCFALAGAIILIHEERKQ